MRNEPEKRPSLFTREEHELLFDLTYSVSASPFPVGRDPTGDVPAHFETALMNKLRIQDRRRLAHYAKLEWLVAGW
jgi:hypothetical protein